MITDYYNKIFIFAFIETPHVQEADEEDDDEYEDEEDEGYEILFEKPVTLTAEHEDSVKPMSQGIGDIRIIQHSDSSYYVEMEDESNRVLCRAPILGDAEVQVSLLLLKLVMFPLFSYSRHVYLCSDFI